MNDDMQICPACGTANPISLTRCNQCSQPFTFSMRSGEEHPISSNQPPLAEREPSHVKIVRPSSRRKFLVGLLGGGALLGVGSLGFAQFIQNLQVAFHTKDYPYNPFFDTFAGSNYSPDLNFMSLTKLGEENNPDAKLHIWDYQRQRMIILPTSPTNDILAGACVWSPDSRYLVHQTQSSNNDAALDLWDMRTQQKIRTYIGDDYTAFSEIHWSPDGSQIALLVPSDSNQMLVIMDSARLVPLFTFVAPTSARSFTWSPDGRKIAFLIRTSESSTWSVQIWDLQTRTMHSNINFSGTGESPTSLAWSPDGTHIAVLGGEQLHILQPADTITSYLLDEPANFGVMAWSPDGRYLAVIATLIGSLGYILDIWDIAQRKLARSFNRYETEANALGWSRDGKRILVIGGSYRQENWDWS